MKLRKTWISSAHQGVVLDKMHSNTLSAFQLAADMGADMIETDARCTKDGVLIVNHDPVVRGFNAEGQPVEYVVSETESDIITSVILAPDDPHGVQYVPTLRQALRLCYYTGMEVNIDLKEGAKHAAEVARLVCEYGLRGRAVYATNGAGTDTMLEIIRIDPKARFIDVLDNYSAGALSVIPDYPARCYIYTNNFSDDNIAKIRATGCMLASINLNLSNAAEGLRHHPDMAEYPHTSDFRAIDAMLLNTRP